MSLSNTRSNNTAAHAAPKILLLDESRMGVAARRSILREAGCEVFTASNTTDGLQLLDAQSIQVLVTEFTKMGGLNFVREAREKNPQLGVIVLSGFTDALGLHESNTGADVVLQKNASEVAQLLRSVKRLLTRKPARKPAARAAGAKAKPAVNSKP